MMPPERLCCWTIDGVLGVHQEIAICDTKGVVPFDYPCAPWNLRVQETIVQAPTLRLKQYLRAAATCPQRPPPLGNKATIVADISNHYVRLLGDSVANCPIAVCFGD